MADKKLSATPVRGDDRGGIRDDDRSAVRCAPRTPAGKLSLVFWDHWVPGANKASEALVDEWAAKEKVEVSDRLHYRRRANKNLLTIAAGAQAQIGPRHSCHADLVAPGPSAQTARAGRRHHGAS